MAMEGRAGAGGQGKAEEGVSAMIAVMTISGTLAAVSFVVLGWLMARSVPVDLLLSCPLCGTPHVDEGDGEVWDNPPHKSHLCAACGCVWRPADVPTNGVRSVRTRGARDTYTY